MPYTLLLGGARSGKSRTAVELARGSGRPVTVIATATPDDTEMAARISRHRAERPDHWSVIEEPTDLEAAVTATDPEAFCLLDCLTLWVANLVETPDTDPVGRAGEAAALLADRPGPGAVVSNEVGWGIVPADPDTRRYRDLLGEVNQVFAACAERAWLLVAGRILTLEAM